MSQKRLGGAAIIQDSKGKVLLVKHGYGKRNWEVPGGLSEQGESAAGTAIREVQEETGLEVKAGRLTGVYYDPSTDMHHFAFTCSSVNDKQPAPTSGEIVECGFFSVDELPRPISDFTEQRIHHALFQDNSSLFHVMKPLKWKE